MTQQDLADKARISREYVSQLESGRKSPTIDTFLRICRAMNVSASAIISRLEKLPRRDS